MADAFVALCQALPIPRINPGLLPTWFGVRLLVITGRRIENQAGCRIRANAEPMSIRLGPVVEDRLQKSLCGPVALAALKHDDNLCCASGQRELSRRCNQARKRVV